jgi:8-amino-3,8-dideoxy-alpha-D-manno-octulosonate transaminase
VHMLGTPANLFEIENICRQNKITLIEDAAWGCGGSLDSRPLGAWGRMGTFSFDFAKTMTTGEGGMIVFQNEADYKAAAAWHDHGHENNPAVPRWEDTRASSGFNFRMTEMQGAVGLAQLKKLSTVVSAQRKNRDSMWSAINNLPGITAREVPVGSYETADALVFSVKDNATARQCRDALVAEGLSTKILPEAVTWHFAGTWSHMPELVARHGGDLSKAFASSLTRLERAVSLPVVVKMDEAVPTRLHKALAKVLK